MEGQDIDLAGERRFHLTAPHSRAGHIHAGGSTDKLLLQTIVPSLHWVQATGRRNQLSNGAAPCHPDLPWTQGLGWDSIGPQFRGRSRHETNRPLCSRGEGSSRESCTLDSFLDQHLWTRDCHYRLCLEASKPLKLNRLEERHRGEIPYFNVSSSMFCNNRRKKGWWTIHRFVISFPESWAIITDIEFWFKL